VTHDIPVGKSMCGWVHDVICKDRFAGVCATNKFIRFKWDKLWQTHFQITQ